MRAHAGQRAVLQSRAFCTAAIAGTGSGKTVIAYLWQLLSMVRRPGQTWIVAEPTERMVRRVLLTDTSRRPSLVTFMRMFDLGARYVAGTGMLYTRYGTMFLSTAERPDTWQGGHVAGAWLDEAGLMSLEAWETCVQRVGYEGGTILITTTPYNMGWLKTEVYDRWLAGDPDYNVMQFPTWANPSYPMAAIERAKRLLSPVRFGMLYEGAFGRPEGLVYDVFDRERHVVEPFELPASWERYGGLDFGFNDPTAGAFLAKSPDGVYYWYDEHYLREETTQRHGAVLMAKGGDAYPWVADSAQPGAIAELRRMGLTVNPAFSKAVNDGIDTVYSLFAADRLRVFSTCKHGLDELESYVWKRSEGGFRDEPVKANDHLLDALRYVLHSLERGGRVQLFT